MDMKRPILLFLLVILSIPSALPAGKSRTLVRESDAVILTPGEAKTFDGVAIPGIRVYAARDGSLQPIPFQVDEKTRKGDFVFPNGKEKNPEDGDGLFNGLDELVIMARDLGDETDEGANLPGAVKKSIIVVKDPVDGGEGFAYLYYFEKDAPARSEVDYATIDPEKNRIKTLTYELGFSAEAPMAMDYLVVTEAGGGDGVDYCDRLKARLHAEVAGISVDKTEEDFDDQIVAWIDGPVRVIRRTRSRLILLWNIPSPSARLDNIYYYNSFSFPTEVYLPIDVGFVVKDPTFRVSVDSPRLAGERRYRNSLYPEGVIQDGKMSDLEKKMAADERPFNWSSTGTVGPDGKDHGAWFNRLIVESDNPDWKPKVFYIDDENHMDPPDLEPGSFGNGGYMIEGITNLSKGTYHLESVMYSSPVFEPAMAEVFMRILDHPLEVFAREIN